MGFVYKLQKHGDKEQLGKIFNIPKWFRVCKKDLPANDCVSMKIQKYIIKSIQGERVISSEFRLDAETKKETEERRTKGMIKLSYFTLAVD